VPRAPAAVLTILVLALAGGCNSGEDEDTGQTSAGASTRPSAAPEPRGERAAAIDRSALAEHLRALQRIATGAGGNRAAGTEGDRVSEAYVIARLREAGWRVRRQSFRFPYFDERSSSLTVEGRRQRRGADFRVLVYSGSGKVSGRTRRFGNGCTRSDFAGLRKGEIAVADRGDCFFRVKAENAERAGAAALLVANDPGEEGVPSATLGAVGARIPVMVVSGPVPLDDGARVTLAVDAVSERRRTANVIAETPGGAGDRVVMAGGHLDSVSSGPGINDNGSGVATLLEAAEAIGPRPSGARVRLGFWGAEELGLLGSRHYVRGLGGDGRRAVAAYLNFDMVGSPNAKPAVYSDGAPDLARLLRQAAGRRLAGESTGGASDHAPFEEAGIPVSGLYTGASEPGPGGEPRDPCYHRGCDRVRNVDPATLLQMARTAAKALQRLSAESS
jgi:Zn-dependent M28 family amino/carboxypeptidase